MSSVVTAVLRRRWALPLVDLARDSAAYYRVAFLGTALRTGILRRLAARSASAEELAAELSYDASLLDGLRSWLDLGVSTGVLRRRGTRYDASRRARRLLAPANDPMAAYYEELVTLDHRLVTEAPERFEAGRPFALEDADAAVIARDSRMGEPWLDAALADVIPAAGPVRLLEVGCGSGALIRSAARRNPELTAVGVELQAPAAAQARENLARWGLADRVSVEIGDIRAREGCGDIDVVTLHQNIYYFPEAEQVELFAHLATFLRPGGTVLVTSVVRGAGLAAAALDLWGAMTAGATRLPEPAALRARMVQAGLRDVEYRPVGPGGMYGAFRGTAS